MKRGSDEQRVVRGKEKRRKAEEWQAFITNWLEGSSQSNKSAKRDQSAIDAEGGIGRD